MKRTDGRTWAVVFVLFASLALNFLDRLVLANVAPVLHAELGLSGTGYSVIVTVFMAGMTLGQLPAGILIDRLGARLALPAIFTGWSVANMAQALARGVASFSALRFVMGVFQCGNYSAGIKVIGGLFPARQRALALAVFDAGTLAGSVVAPPIVVWVLMHFGWRAAFLLPSALSMLWLLPWFRVYARHPAPAAVVAARGAQAVSLIHLLRRPETWGAILMRGLGGPVSQLYWYWLPLYFVRGRGMSMSAMAAFTSLAFLIGAGGNLAGGFISGWLIHRGWGVDASRKLVFVSGVALNACSALVPIVPGNSAAAALIAAAIFGLNWKSCTQLAIFTDVFPEATLARIGGLTGIAEGVFTMVVTLGTGMVVDRFSFTPVFIAAAAMPLFSALALFTLIGRIRRIGFPVPPAPRPAVL